jgi:hypothetical protein
VTAVAFVEGLGFEGPKLVLAFSHHAVAPFRHLVPGAREVADRLREEERARLALTRVPKRPQPLAVGGRDRALERVLDAPPFSAVLEEADCARDRVRRIVIEAERQSEVEQGFGVGLSLDLGTQRLIDREHEVAFDRREPVVHEHPAAVAEGVTVRLLYSRADRGTKVCEEEVRADVRGELAEF